MQVISRHRTTTIVLHWLSFAIVIIALGSVLARELFEDSEWRKTLMVIHKSAGFLFIWVSLVRILCRLFFFSPPIQAPLPKYLTLAATLSHAAIYMLLVLLPLSGWLFVSAAGKPIVLFGVFPIFSILDKNRDLAEVLGEVHEVLAWVFVSLIVLHVVAALWHHLVRKDKVLTSMLISNQGNDGGNK
jgi:superoxide oxidase